MNKTQLQKVRDALWLPENSTDEEFAQFSEAFAILNRELAAPQRKWVGLTDEEISRIHRVYCASWDAQYFAHVTHAIEAALKERNHG